MRVDAIASARTLIARAAAAVLLAGLGTGFFLQMYARMAHPGGNDLGARLAAARILVGGGNPYTLEMSQGHGPYPLTIDLLVIPLTWVPLGLAQSLWFLMSVAALVGSLLILDRLWRCVPDGGSSLDVPFVVRLAALAVVLFIPLQNHLRYGQLNLLLLCLCVLFLALHLRGREHAGTASLGSAIALKLTPAVLLLYLGRERRVRAATLAIGWTLLLAVGLPALITSRALEWYRDGWLPEVIRLSSGPVVYEWRTRFSLAAVLTEFWPRLSTMPGLRFAAAAAVLGPILWAQPRLARDPRGVLVLFALYLIAMPLVSPVSETHHLVVLAGPLWIWLLAAGCAPRFPVMDGAGALVFIGAHWLGSALAGPAASRRGSLFDSAALLTLYGVLLLRGVWMTRGTPARAAA